MFAAHFMLHLSTNLNSNFYSNFSAGSGIIFLHVKFILYDTIIKLVQFESWNNEGALYASLVSWFYSYMQSIRIPCTFHATTEEYSWCTALSLQSANWSLDARMHNAYSPVYTSSSWLINHFWNNSSSLHIPKLATCSCWLLLVSAFFWSRP